MMAERITFNEKQPDIAWQKSLRDRYSDEPPPPVSLELKSSVVKRVSRRIAEAIILKYEWLGTLPMCSAYYGLFFGSYCAGVACWNIGGGGANVSAHMEWNLDRTELAYLCRGANTHWSPPGANSRLVSLSCRLIAKDFPIVKLAIAYSDTDAGEIGTIYQACNWTCAGRGSSVDQWVSSQGRVMDKKVVGNAAEKSGQTRGAVTAALIKSGWTQQKSNPKWRYVFPLKNADAPLVALVKLKSVPYPKRTTRPKQATVGTTDERQCNADPGASTSSEGIA